MRQRVNPQGQHHGERDRDGSAYAPRKDSHPDSLLRDAQCGNTGWQAPNISLRVDGTESSYTVQHLCCHFLGE